MSEPEVKKLTANEIIALIVKEHTLWEIGTGEVPHDSVAGYCAIKDWYGGKGQGEKWYRVYYFADHDVYLRIDGIFEDNKKAYFDDPPYEVFPHQKLITQYY